MSNQVTIKLLDGYEDPETKQVYKNLVMRMQSMQDEIDILKDASLNDLLEKQYRYSDDVSPVEQELALLQQRRFKLLIYNRLVVNLGPLSADQVRNKQALARLTARDFTLIGFGLRAPEQKLVPLNLVTDVIERTIKSDEVKRELKGGLNKALGESESESSQ